jgi:acyl-CoA dehydrogenase
MTPTMALAGGVCEEPADDPDTSELRRLVDDLGQRSFAERSGRPRLPEHFDQNLWRNLEQTGLSRPTSTPELGAGPSESAIVLYGLARHAGAVPIAETDLLAAWLGAQTGLTLPATGPLTVAIADGEPGAARIAGTAVDTPWTMASAAVMLIARTPASAHVAVVDQGELDIVGGHNMGGEPRDRVRFDLPAKRFRAVDASVADELLRRGAWARCVQIIGVLDAVAAMSVAHTRDRVQFGHPLSAFQAVQHSLASMAGEIERARAATTLAVAAASDYGFAAEQTDYAVTVAKVVLGRVVDAVTTVAHQLHGAIGSTLEHPLWQFTMRAQSWIGEFGSTRDHARHLGQRVIAADNPWDVVFGIVNSGQVGPR